MNTNPVNSEVSSSEGNQPSVSVAPEYLQTSVETVESPKKSTYSRRPSELLKTIRSMKVGEIHFVPVAPELLSKEVQKGYAMASRLRRQFKLNVAKLENGYQIQKAAVIQKVKFLDMPYKIESGIPIPSPLRGSNGYRGAFPIDKLKVGDSFLLPCVKKDMKSKQHRLHCAFLGWAKKHKGFKGITRRVGKGIRAWRIA